MLRPGRIDVPSGSSVQLSGVRGSILVSRPGPAVICLSVGGRSVDDLQDALTHELETDFVIQGELTLFLDAREAAAEELLRSARWSQWFRAHRGHLVSVIALVHPDAARSVVETARGAGGLRDRLEIFTDVNTFERAQEMALRSVIDSGTWSVADRWGPRGA